MTDERTRREAFHLWRRAEEEMSHGDPTDACRGYIRRLDSMPELKAVLKRAFFLALSVAAKQVIASQDRDAIRDVHQFYEDATRIYTDCEECSYEFGNFLLRLGGHLSDAVIYLRQALRRNKDCVPAYRRLNSVYHVYFGSRHYRMLLNDEEYTNAFQKAIEKKVKQGYSSILNIQTGTGLFCWYALDAGANKVYGCDDNPAILTVANHVRQRLGPLSANVTLIEKHCSTLSIPTDIPERVSLVVMDIMDAGLLGEHLLQTVSHAWKNFLRPPSPIPALRSSLPASAVIPRSGSVWFTLVESRELARQYMFPLSSSVDPEHFAQELANISLGSGPSSRAQSLSFMNLFVRLDEPYDSQRVQTFSDLKCLTGPQRLLHVDFNDPNDVDKHLRDANRSQFQVECTVEGEFHAVVAWFQLQVDDDIELSSRPDGAKVNICCWEQAVFPCSQGCRVAPGSVVTLSSSHSEGKILLHMEQIVQPGGYAYPLERGALPAPSSFVRMLNDVDLMEQFRLAAEKFVEGNVMGKEISVLDSFPVPVFGLTVLRHLSRLGASRKLQLYCVAESALAEDVIGKIAERNGIPSEMVRFVDLDQLPWPIDDEFRLDAMVLDVLDQNGDLKENVVKCVECFKCALKPGGIMLPSKVEVWGQLMYSEYIERCTRVGSRMMERIGIAKAMNEYQVSQMLDMNLPSLSCNAYANSFMCHAFTLSQICDEQWKKSLAVRIEQTVRVNAIPYWYNLHFSVDDEAASSCSTFHRFSYVHQAAFVLKSPVVLNIAAFFTFVYFHNGFIIRLGTLLE